MTLMVARFGALNFVWFFLEHPIQVYWGEGLMSVNKVISGIVLPVNRPKQQFHSSDGHRLVNQVKGQSHQAQLTERCK